MKRLFPLLIVATFVATMAGKRSLHVLAPFWSTIGPEIAGRTFSARNFRPNRRPEQETT